LTSADELAFDVNRDRDDDLRIAPHYPAAREADGRESFAFFDRHPAG
jgi:hypothetical protein